MGYAILVLIIIGFLLYDWVRAGRDTKERKRVNKAIEEGNAVMAHLYSEVERLTNILRAHGINPESGVKINQ